MRPGCLWLARSAAIVAALSAPPVRASATGAIRLGQIAQSPTAPVQQPDAPANAGEQIRKAQVELKRLNCLKGRIDGKLGPQTRKAVKDFWVMAKEPVVEVSITDALIADLSERGDNYCRPARPFFSFGGRGPGGFVPPFAPVGRGPLPGAVPQPSPPDAAH
jgi:peptidoglycan hydrolase-like protein with peptidoglycan-binding domain